MTKIDKTIARLKEIINDPNCHRMNLSNVKGYLGELMVKQILEQHGVSVIQTGNQSGYDLELKEKGIKIDVKFSTPKEASGCPPYWGWALKHKNKYEPVNLYIIKKNDYPLFPQSGIGQFKNVLNAFGLLENTRSIDRIEKDKLIDYFNTCRMLVKNKKVVKMSPSGNILRALK